MLKNKPLLDMVRAQKAGRAIGVYSVCSANRFVIAAAIEQAATDGGSVLVESTSNQVDQFGGYTGMTPSQFVAYVEEIAEEAGFPSERIVLGGDHLGPNAWQSEAPDRAMSKACDLVRRYVRAGYTKIHLDASMHLGDDPGDRHQPLAEDVVARRAARLCRVAEDTHSELPDGAPEPVYVVGTEVPVPGGVPEEEAVSVTTVEDAARTVEVGRQAFRDQGLEGAWERVIGLVVQPGVEFGDSSIHEFHPPAAAALSRFIESSSTLVYEAHSTDYQTPSCLRGLVEAHYAILKVGPWLTFAFREALFGLEFVESELLKGRSGWTPSGLSAALESVMVDDPKHWRKYYRGDEHDVALARKYSFSDRSRYYWVSPVLASAMARLIDNLRRIQMPLALLSQYVPNQYHAIRNGELPNDPVAVIHHRIREVTSMYAYACGQRPSWRP